MTKDLTTDVVMRQIANMATADLHPDLQGYVTEVTVGDEAVPILQHPLVVMPFIIPGLANQQYEQKLKQLEEPYYEDLLRRIWLYERPYRLETAVHWAEMGNIFGSKLRKLLSRVWIDMEGDGTLDSPLILRVIDVFRKAGFTSDTGRRQPRDPLRVYRGGLPNGIAWSTDLAVAEWFATRFSNHEPEPVHQAMAPWRSVLAMLDKRGESEVIVDPRLLVKVRVR